MSELLATFDTVDERLTFRNGEVIGNAFRDASINCVNCKYPDNAEDFSFWLYMHTRNKKHLHRIKRHLESHCNNCYPCHWQCESCQGFKNEIYKATIEANSTRKTVKQMWPCTTCITLYNPTARINHVLRNDPEMKGFLDVRFD